MEDKLSPKKVSFILKLITISTTYELFWSRNDFFPENGSVMAIKKKKGLSWSKNGHFVLKKSKIYKKRQKSGFWSKKVILRVKNDQKVKNVQYNSQKPLKRPFFQKKPLMWLKLQYWLIFERLAANGWNVFSNGK